MTNSEIKKNLRKKIRKIRESLSFEEKESLSDIIIRKFLEDDVLKNSKTIMSYMAFKNEIETNKLHKYLLELGKTILLPKMIGDNIIPIKISESFSYGEFGVLEPIGDEFLENIDLIIVPGVVFNKIGDRIGFGKGFYDRFLSCEKYKISHKISLAYDFQIDNSFSGEKFDMKIDKLITEKEILIF